MATTSANTVVSTQALKETQKSTIAEPPRSEEIKTLEQTVLESIDIKNKVVQSAKNVLIKEKILKKNYLRSAYADLVLCLSIVFTTIFALHGYVFLSILTVFIGFCSFYSPVIIDLCTAPLVFASGLYKNWNLLKFAQGVETNMTYTEKAEKLNEMLTHAPIVLEQSRKALVNADKKLAMVMGTKVETDHVTMESMEKIVNKLIHTSDHPWESFVGMVKTHFPAGEKIFFLFSQITIFVLAQKSKPFKWNDPMTMLFANSIQHALSLDTLLKNISITAVLSLATSLHSQVEGKPKGQSYDTTLLGAFKETLKIFMSVIGYKGDNPKLDYTAIRDLSSTMQLVKNSGQLISWVTTFFETVIDTAHLHIYKVPWKRDKLLLVRVDQFMEKYSELSLQIPFFQVNFTKDPMFAHRINDMNIEAQEISKILVAKNIPQSNWGPFFQIMRCLNDVMPNVAAALNKTKSRPKPFGILLKGEPGHGKSTLIQVLTPIMQKAYIKHVDKNYPEWNYESVWNRNPTTEHDDGYADQFCTAIDDFGQNKTDVEMVKQSELLIRFLNPIPTMLKMASLADKGNSFFQSKVVIVTTNLIALGEPVGLASPDALLSRFNYTLEVRVAPKYKNKGRGWDVAKLKHDFGECYYDHIWEFKKSTLGVAIGSPDPWKPFTEVIPELLKDFIISQGSVIPMEDIMMKNPQFIAKFVEEIGVGQAGSTKDEASDDEPESQPEIVVEGETPTFAIEPKPDDSVLVIDLRTKNPSLANKVQSLLSKTSRTELQKRVREELSQISSKLTSSKLPIKMRKEALDLCRDLSVRVLTDRTFVRDLQEVKKENANMEICDWKELIMQTIEMDPPAVYGNYLMHPRSDELTFIPLLVSGNLEFLRHNSKILEITEDEMIALQAFNTSIIDDDDLELIFGGQATTKGVIQEMEKEKETKVTIANGLLAMEQEERIPIMGFLSNQEEMNQLMTVCDEKNMAIAVREILGKETELQFVVTNELDLEKIDSHIKGFHITLRNQILMMQTYSLEGFREIWSNSIKMLYSVKWFKELSDVGQQEITMILYGDMGTLIETHLQGKVPDDQIRLYSAFFKSKRMHYFALKAKFEFDACKGKLKKVWDEASRSEKVAIGVAASMGAALLGFGLFKTGQKLLTTFNQESEEDADHFLGDAQAMTSNKVYEMGIPSTGRVKPKNRRVGRRKEHLGHGQSYSTKSVAECIHNTVIPNVVEFQLIYEDNVNIRHFGNLFFTHQTYAYTAAHFFDWYTVSQTKFMLVLNENGKIRNYGVGDVKFRFDPDNDLVLLTFDSKKMNQKKDLTALIATDEEVANLIEPIALVTYASSNGKKVPKFIQGSGYQARSVGVYDTSVAINQRRHVKDFFYAEAPTLDGYCGGPWMYATDTGVKIFGIHTFGGKHKSGGMYLTKEVIEDVFISRSTYERFVMDSCGQSGTYFMKGDWETYVKQDDTRVYRSSLIGLLTDEEITANEKEIIDALPCAEVIGVVKPKFKHRLPRRTELKPSLFHGYVPPSARFPAHLWQQKECIEGCTSVENTPLVAALHKLNREPFVMKNKHFELAQEVAEDILLNFPSPLHKKNPFLSDDEILNGGGTTGLAPLNRKTSNGFKFDKVTDLPDEYCEFDVQAQRWKFTDAGYVAFDQFETAFTDGNEDIVVMFEANLKDELRAKHTTRVFYCGPKVYTMLVRKYFGRFIDTMHENCMSGSARVGINPHSFDWDDLYSQILTFSEEPKIFPDDYSGWDMSNCHQLNYICHWILINWYKREYPHISTETLNVMWNILSAIRRPFILVVNVIFRLWMSTISGHPLTTTHNSLGNELAQRTCAVYLVRKHVKKQSSILGNLSGKSKVPPSFVRKHFNPNVFGDDGLSVVGKKLQGIVNLQTMSAAMWKLFGMVMTDANKFSTEKKEFHDIEELSFLKRYFVRGTGGYIHGALEKSVIIDMLNWVRMNNTQEGTLINAHNAMREAYHWGREFYETICNMVRYAATMSQLDGIEYLTFNEIDREFIEGDLSHAWNWDLEDDDEGQELEDKPIFGSEFLGRGQSAMETVVTQDLVSEETNVVGITSFNDIPMSIEECSALNTQMMQGTTAFPQPSVEILKRPVSVSIPWQTTSGVGSTIYIASYPGTFFGQNELFAKTLGNFTNFRCDGVDIEIRMTSSMHHMGALMALFLPAFRGITNSPTTGDMSELIYRASNMKHLLISANSPRVTKMFIPFVGSKQYLEFWRGGDEVDWRLGTLQLLVLQPLSDTNGGNIPITLTVTAQFVNPRVAGPCPFYNIMVSEELGHGQAKSRRKKRVQVREAESEGSSGVLSSGLRTAASIAPILSIVPVVGEVAAVAGPILSTVANLFDAMGMDKPNNQDVMQPMLTNMVENMSLGTGLDSAQKISLTPGFYIANSPIVMGEEKDLMDINVLKRVPACIGLYTINSTVAVGSPIIAIPVTPTMAKVFKTTYGADKFSSTYSTFISSTHLSNLATNFDFWTGDMKYVLYIFTSSFISGRMRITWLPEGSVMPTVFAGDGNLISKVFDFAGDCVVPFTIPYEGPAPFRQCVPIDALYMNLATSSYNGTWVLSLDTRLTHSFDSAAVKVSVAVYQSGGETLRFVQPRRLWEGYYQCLLNPLRVPSSFLPTDDEPEELGHGQAGRAITLSITDVAALIPNYVSNMARWNEKHIGAMPKYYFSPSDMGFTCTAEFNGDMATCTQGTTKDSVKHGATAILYEMIHGNLHEPRRESRFERVVPKPEPVKEVKTSTPARVQSFGSQMRQLLDQAEKQYEKGFADISVAIERMNLAEAAQAELQVQNAELLRENELLKAEIRNMKADKEVAARRFNGLRSQLTEFLGHGQSAYEEYLGNGQSGSELCPTDFFDNVFPPLIPATSVMISSGLINEEVGDLKTLFHRYQIVGRWQTTLPNARYNEGYLTKTFDDSVVVDSVKEPHSGLSMFLNSVAFYRGSFRYKLTSRYTYHRGSDNMDHEMPIVKVTTTTASPGAFNRNQATNVTTYFDVQAPSVTSSTLPAQFGGENGILLFDMSNRAVVEFEVPYTGLLPFEETVYQLYRTINPYLAQRRDRRVPLVTQLPNSALGANQMLDLDIWAALGDDFSVGGLRVPMPLLTAWNGNLPPGGYLPEEGFPENLFQNDILFLRKNGSTASQSRDVIFTKSDNNNAERVVGRANARSGFKIEKEEIPLLRR